MHSGTARRRPLDPLLVVFAGGVVAGTLDISYAVLFWGVKADVSPISILQSVAAGLYGDAAFEGGLPMATLGLALHFSIAISMAMTYALVAQRWAFLVARPVLAGATYGLLLYGIMNFVVIPLSAVVRHGPTDPLWTGLSIVVHMGLIGVPIALFARHALANNG